MMMTNDEQVMDEMVDVPMLRPKDPEALVQFSLRISKGTRFALQVLSLRTAKPATAIVGDAILEKLRGEGLAE